VLPPLWFLAASALIAFSLERQVLWTLIKGVTNIPLRGNTPLAYVLVISSAVLVHNVFVKVVPHRSLWPHHFVAVFSAYGFYSYLRNSLGSTAGVHTAAINNASRVVDFERALHLGFEPALQRFWLSLPFRGLITLLGGYYTIAHALCTALVLVFLYRSNRSRYAYALSTIATSCVVALVCFRFFPTMPPRLFALHDSSFVMTDVLSAVSTSSPSAELLRMSNQYAAIPSMHCAWAFFTVLMLYPYRKLRLLAIGHFALTVLIVLVTAHHFWIDVLIGMFAVSLLPVVKRVRARA
jgi:hypothetical protein